MGSHAIAYAVVALAVAAACLIAGFVWGRSNVKAQVENAVEKEHVALDAREFAMRTQLEDAIAEVSKLRPIAEELGRVQKRLEREQAKYVQLKAEFNSDMGIASETSASEDSEPELLPGDESADEAIQKLLQSLEVFNDPNAQAVAEPASNPNPAPASPSHVVPAVAVPVAKPPANVRPAEAPRPADVPKPAEVARVVASARPAPPVQPKPAPPAPPPASKTVAPAPVAPPRPAAPQPQKVASAELRPPMPNQPSKPAAAAPAKAGQKVDEWQEFARQLEALTGKKK